MPQYVPKHPLRERVPTFSTKSTTNLLRQYLSKDKSSSDDGQIVFHRTTQQLDASPTESTHIAFDHGQSHIRRCHCHLSARLLCPCPGLQYIRGWKTWRHEKFWLGASHYFLHHQDCRGISTNRDNHKPDDQ